MMLFRTVRRGLLISGAMFIVLTFLVACSEQAEPPVIPTIPAIHSYDHDGYPVFTVEQASGEYRVNINYVRDGMHVFVTANIVGGRSSNPAMHCVGPAIRWGEEVVETIKYDCMPYDGEQKFQRSHRFDYKFMEPGNAEIIFERGSLRSAPMLVHLNEKTSSPGILTPTEAQEETDGTHVHVWGSYYIDETSTGRLCEVVFTEDLPDCDHPIKVKNMPEAIIPYLYFQDGISWMKSPIVLAGKISNGVLTAIDDAN